MSAPESAKPEPSLPFRVGPYLLQRLVGRGRTGFVYDAVNAETGQRTAIKLMHAGEGSALGTSTEVALFAREALVLAQMPPHPNIVRVLTAGVADQKPFIAMEFVDGVPMSEWMSRLRPGSAASVRLLRDVALAIHHAHEGGVIHRDLNPLHILVGRGGRPCVTAFAHARSLTADQRAMSSAGGTVVAVPAYMSPELAQGQKADRRSDVYSLGAMLYEMLAGQPPFTGHQPVATLLRVIQDPVPPLPPAVDAPGRAVQAACLKALAKDPAERFPTAKDFADALTAGLETRADPGTSPSSSRGVRWALGVGAALAAAGLLYLLVRLLKG